MTTKRYCLALLVIILSISFMCCSQNKNKPAPAPSTDGFKLPTISKTTYPVINLPVWLLYVPEGKNAVGIAWDTPQKPKLVNKYAHDFATTSLANNHSPYAADKSTIIEYAEQNDAEIKEDGFKVTVSPDPDYKLQADRSIKYYAETAFNGYKLFLYSLDTPEINKDIIQASVANTPEWCKNDITYTEGDYIYTIGFAQDASLINAWKQAQENGLKKMAQYRLMNIVSLVRTTVGLTNKMQIVETTLKSPDASINKTWLFQKIVNNSSDYSVFLLLKSKKTL